MKKIMFLVITIMFLIPLSGCAHRQKYHWVHNPSTSQEELNRAIYECNAEANVLCYNGAVWCYPQQYNSCMTMKYGYTKVIDQENKSIYCDKNGKCKTIDP